MIILDTDHISMLQRPQSREGLALRQRLNQSADADIVTTIISAEEQLRAWLALINRYRDARQQTAAYGKFHEFLNFYALWRILDFDPPAAIRFQQLRQGGIRIGAMDLKIASMTLIHDATLLTRNRRDFERVPGLKFEDWSVEEGA